MARSSRVFNLLYILCTTLFIGGLYFDGWSHLYRFQEIDTFFNIYHVPLEAGYLSTTLTLLAWTFSRKTKNQSWQDAIPAGHGLSLLGCMLFGIGTLLDITWHEVFGFEQGVEGLISPSHLMLATGMWFALSGGARHLLQTRTTGYPSFVCALPVLLSTTYTMMLMIFLTHYGRYTEILIRGIPPDPMGGYYEQMLAILGVLVFSAIFMGSLSFVMKHIRLPLGSVTLLLVTQITALTLIRAGLNLVPSAIIAGVIGDIALYAYQERGLPRSWWPGIGFLLPSMYYAIALLIIFFTDGIWWSVHLWTGLPVLAGFSGALTSFLATGTGEREK